MPKSFISRLAAIGLLTAATTSFAHHGWSEYDLSKPITLKGEITSSGYEHPHAYLKLLTEKKEWLATLAPPSRMSTRGLPREALKTGAEATLYGYPHRTNGDEMRVERMTIGGKTVELRR